MNPNSLQSGGALKDLADTLRYIYSVEGYKLIDDCQKKLLEAIVKLDQLIGDTSTI